MEYKIEKFTPRYFTSLVQLLDQSFRIKNKNKEQLVTWKLFDSFHQKKTVIYIAVDEHQKTVSQYTNIPLVLRNNIQDLKASMCLDMATLKDHRGKGLISKLSKKVYEEITSQNTVVSIGFSNEKGVKVDKNAKGYGYKVIGKFVTYVSFVLVKRPTPFTLEVIDEFKTEFHDTSASLHIKKSREYLTWRYRQKPHNRYIKYVIVEQGKEVGYVILLFSKLRCYVLDIIVEFVDNVEKMQGVLRAIKNTAYDHTSRMVIYTVFDNTYWTELFSSGRYFKNTKSKPVYYLTVKPHHENTSELTTNPENWFLMGGDIL